ncbi:Hypothetical protein SRAE_1000204400 [Strongyloides ratti]|uniref:Uncharacterized protein n=1 Tax=Strongyloides ratti TaxID=34506 RepID=A0A090L1W4_STRRB|nr:Hypothetical protein SRAE_1000204400 [Strongyloides ratti]CEF63786.1 Hypothetical protein SRAE_1000204400 [Strongyloides ratti]
MTENSDFLASENVIGYIKSTLMGRNNVDLEVIIKRVEETFNLDLKNYAYELNYGNDRSTKTVANYIADIEGSIVNVVNKGSYLAYLISFNLSANSIKAAMFCRQTKDGKGKKKNKDIQKSNKSHLTKLVYKQPTYNIVNEQKKVLVSKKNELNQPKVEIGKRRKFKKIYSFPSVENTPDIFKKISFTKNKINKDVHSVSVSNNYYKPVIGNVRNSIKSSNERDTYARIFGGMENQKILKQRQNLFEDYENNHERKMDNYLWTTNATYNEMDYGTKVDTSKGNSSNTILNEYNFVQRNSNIHKIVVNNAQEIKKNVHTNFSTNFFCNNKKISQKLEEDKFLPQSETIILTQEMKHLLVSFSKLSIH